MVRSLDTDNKRSSTNGLTVLPPPVKTPEIKISAKSKAKAPSADILPEAPVRKPSLVGQNGTKIVNLRYEKLNPSEKKVADVFRAKPPATQLNISQMAAEAFADVPPDKAKLVVRNALRRLVRGDFLVKVSRGTFRLSDTASSHF